MTGKFAGLELEVDRSVKVRILHPVSRQPLRDAAGAEAYIEMHSGDSEVARKHQRNVARRRIAMRGRGKITPEELEAEGVELLVALTVGWRLVALDGGALDVPFTQDNARDLFSSPRMTWLREQVEEAVGDRENFRQASSTN